VVWEEENQDIPFIAKDTDSNGLLDYLEWITPHTSEQHFSIILITKAEHLDENKTFVSDIYEAVKEQDGTWSEEIPEGHWVRVTFG